MLGSFSKPPPHAAAAERVAGWTRQRFTLPADAAVLVSELQCAQIGCPPLETVVAFWTENATTQRPQRHHFKVFKPVAGVCQDDLPYAWMKNALVLPEGEGCECC